MILGLPQLNEYLTILDGMNPEKVLAKLVEASTDAFFNIPSVLTTQLWGKWSSAYLYQFDHISDAKSSGKQFLKPLPLVSKGNAKGFSAHGDDLGFLFDVYDVLGNKIEGTELTTDRDKKARKNFMEMIVKFAYLNSSQADLYINNQLMDPFKADASRFIKVSESIELFKDFRFCQLSLWGAPLKASQKISCDFLSERLKKLPLPLPKTGVLGNPFG